MSKHTLVRILLGINALCIIFCYSFFAISLALCVTLLAITGVVYMAITAIGAYFIQLNYFIRSVNRGETSEKVISISFDDGPHANTYAVLDMLKKYQIKASFFIIGKNIAGKEAILKRMDEEGHSIGNHSFAHSYWYSIKPVPDLIADITNCNRILSSVLNKNIGWFRPPYGVTNPRIAAAIQDTNMTSIGWSVRSYDTMNKDIQQPLSRMVKKIKGGDIILMHDHLDTAAQLLEELILYCNSNQIKIVPLEKLINTPSYV